ncbi:hypothetical protein CEXT_23491 [Caerostris extrusa]|uniref:Uncharacterized protein n=1 Tax=Caerostris extrusa TaxID=172846 RepID=A0AAV4P647_CAEEX|nr:hypothetical protein CEXT_23491 [Caerostris extrusa]
MFCVRNGNFPFVPRFHPFTVSTGAESIVPRTVRWTLNGSDCINQQRERACCGTKPSNKHTENASEKNNWLCHGCGDKARNVAFTFSLRAVDNGLMSGILQFT